MVLKKSSLSTKMEALLYTIHLFFFPGLALGTAVSFFGMGLAFIASGFPFPCPLDAVRASFLFLNSSSTFLTNGALSVSNFSQSLILSPVVDSMCLIVSHLICWRIFSLFKASQTSLSAGRQDSPKP